MSTDVATLVTNVSWLSERLGRAVASATLDDTDLKKLNTTSYMRWMTVAFEDGTTTSLVLKVCLPAARSQMLGLPREAFFLQHWKELKTADGTTNLVESVLPEVFFAEGSMETGAKTILMQDLSACVQSGYFFGGGNPNNWGKDLTALQKDFSVSVAEATTLAFSAAAKFHAAYWNSAALRGQPSLNWLRQSEWLDGKAQASWHASQETIASAWAKYRPTLETSGVNWEPLLVACVDASVAKVADGAGWDAFQAELQARPFTLVHGDFHPANFMVRRDEGVYSLVLLDWEVVGLGSGPQDLGQVTCTKES